VGRADTYSQPDAPDMVLPEGIVLGLARAHMSAPDLISSVLAVDESGGEARAYLLDGGVVVKPSGRTGCDHGPAWRRRPRCSPPPSQRCRGGSRRCWATPRWTPGPARSSSSSSAGLAGNAVVTEAIGLAGSARAECFARAPRCCDRPRAGRERAAHRRSAPRRRRRRQAAPPRRAGPGGSRRAL